MSSREKLKLRKGMKAKRRVKEREREKELLLLFTIVERGHGIWKFYVGNTVRGKKMSNSESNSLLVVICSSALSNECEENIQL